MPGVSAIGTIQEVRLRTPLAVAALVMVAGGVASALATPGFSTPGNAPSIQIGTDAGAPLVQATNLYPTSRRDPDPRVVAETTLPVKLDAPVRLSAQCECAPGTPEADQFSNLAIEVRTPGHVYDGALGSLDATIDAAVTGVTVRVWLVDNGRLQAQGVTSKWTFVAAPVTGPGTQPA
jgi:hypothetical protein